MQDLFAPFVEPLMKKVQQRPPVSDDLLVEVLGILANTSFDQVATLPVHSHRQHIFKFDVVALLDDTEVLDFVVERLAPGATEDDIVLQVRASATAAST